MLVQVAVEAGGVVYPLAALGVAWDVLRAVVAVVNHVRVESARVESVDVPVADLERDKEGALVVPTSGSSSSSNNAVVVEAARVVADARVQVGHFEAGHVRIGSQLSHDASAGAVRLKGAAAAAGLGFRSVSKAARQCIAAAHGAATSTTSGDML